MAQIMFFFLVQSISLIKKYTLNKNISTDEEKSEAETILWVTLVTGSPMALFSNLFRLTFLPDVFQSKLL